MVYNGTINYMAKRGRKKLPAKKRRKRSIHLRLRQDENDWLEQEAEKEKMSVQEFIRFVLMRGKK